MFKKVLEKIRNGDYGERFLKVNSGVVVVIDVKIGNVFVFISYFLYNFNIFIKGIIISEWNKLINDFIRLMFNRVIVGVYFFGLIFKIFLVIVGF